MAASSHSRQAPRSSCAHDAVQTLFGSAPSPAPFLPELKEAATPARLARSLTVVGVPSVPLQVHYQERFSAAGRTAGGYLKRDGRPKDQEVLKARARRRGTGGPDANPCSARWLGSHLRCREAQRLGPADAVAQLTCPALPFPQSRLVDRPLRPMMQDGWPYDTQVLSWVMSYDGAVGPEPLAITAAGAALAVSDIPIKNVVAGVRCGPGPEAPVPCLTCWEEG